MIELHINGQQFSFDSTDVETLEQALSVYFENKQQSTFALALNGEFVGKEAYKNTRISTGDSIDIMFPIQGG